jgi:hypothetical protein
LNSGEIVTSAAGWFGLTFQRFAYISAIRGFPKYRAILARLSTGKAEPALIAEGSSCQPLDGNEMKYYLVRFFTVEQ